MKGVPCDIESVINIVSYCRVSKTVSICMCTTQCRNAFKWRYKQNIPIVGGGGFLVVRGPVLLLEVGIIAIFIFFIG